MKAKYMLTWVSIFAVLMINVLAGAADPPKLTDAESATHGTDDAQHQIVDTYKFPGFEIVQINLPVLSHYSYILRSGNEALIVDPDRDVQFYLDYAAKNGLTIKGVYLTHSHADFVAGHLEIVKAANCPIYQSASSGAGYKIEGMKDGSTFPIGSAILRILETPGHTPDGTCAVVYASQDDRVGKTILTGDTLFIGSVGRPDLLEGKMTAAALASMGFDSWTDKLSKLDDSILVLPAHGAGSLCGAHLSDSPQSTIGAERTSNPYLQFQSRSDFIMAVLRELPETPQYFGHNAAMNRVGPPLVNWDAPAEEANTDKDLTDSTKNYLADIRNATAYAAEHIPNSVNIALRGRLETWVGIMVPWAMQMDGELVLLGSKEELKEALFRLNRIGYKARTITLETWKSANLPTRKVDLIKPVELYSQMKAGKEPMIVDVRLPSEWMGLRIGNVVNLPLNRLSELSSKLDPDQPVITVCNSAYRSSMAIGVLEGKGFKNVTSMEGGSEAWVEAGLPVFGADVTKPAFGSSVANRQIKLADRISADELRRLAKDLPGTFSLVDIRPADQFADYSIPGSQNVDIAEVLANPVYLTGAGPLIIADRDGSLAMQVAGILSQKTQRTIKALYGGLEAYWKDSSPKESSASVATPVKSTTPAVVPPPMEAPKSTPPTSPKKKSAGC